MRSICRLVAMFDFHEKRKIKSVVYSKFSVAAILALSIALSFSVFERFTVEREMVHKKEAKEAELEALRERAAVLESKVEHLGNERGIEEELRSRFDVAKEGEQVVIILDDEEADTDLEKLSQPPRETDDDEGGSFWKLLKFW